MPPNTPEEMPTPPPPLDGERRVDEVTRNGRADEQAPQQFAAHSVRVHAHHPAPSCPAPGGPEMSHSSQIKFRSIRRRNNNDS